MHLDLPKDQQSLLAADSPAVGRLGVQPDSFHGQLSRSMKGAEMFAEDLRVVGQAVEAGECNPGVHDVAESNLVGRIVGIHIGSGRNIVDLVVEMLVDSAPDADMRPGRSLLEVEMRAAAPYHKSRLFVVAAGYKRSQAADCCKMGMSFVLDEVVVMRVFDTVR
jgi:hypothetical protein